MDTSTLYFNEDHEALRAMVRKFVDQEINPHMDQWEQSGWPAHEVLGKMGELGLLGITYDPEYGGQGLDYWFDLVFLEEIGHIQGVGVQAAITDQTHMATPALHEFGSDYLKETYLKPAVAGRMVAAIAVTEPDAGSDVAALKTRARRDGESYVINGSKTFITNGVQSDFVVLLARTSDEPGYHSFSLFVVPKGRPGFNVGRKLDKVGLWSSDTAELFFEDVRVPRENLIGEEGQGFIYQMKQFQHERFVTLPLTYSAATDIIKMTTAYIGQRIVFGKPLLQRQVLRHRIAEWLAEIEALRALAYHITRMKVNKLDVTREVTKGKLLGGPMIRRVADGCLQMFGGMGFMNESLISRYWRDARAASIAGGADEVLAEVLVRLEGY
jgi:citronellyl-CoA dehydrogenase